MGKNKHKKAARKTPNLSAPASDEVTSKTMQEKRIDASKRKIMDLTKSLLSEENKLTEAFQQFYERALGTSEDTKEAFNTQTSLIDKMNVWFKLLMLDTSRLGKQSSEINNALQRLSQAQDLFSLILLKYWSRDRNPTLHTPCTEIEALVCLVGVYNTILSMRKAIFQISNDAELSSKVDCFDQLDGALTNKELRIGLMRRLLALRDVCDEGRLEIVSRTSFGTKVQSVNINSDLAVQIYSDGIRPDKAQIIMAKFAPFVPSNGGLMGVIQKLLLSFDTEKAGNLSHEGIQSLAPQVGELLSGDSSKLDFTKLIQLFEGWCMAGPLCEGAHLNVDLAHRINKSYESLICNPMPKHQDRLIHNEYLHQYDLSVVTAILDHIAWIKDNFTIRNVTDTKKPLDIHAKTDKADNYHKDMIFLLDNLEVALLTYFNNFAMLVSAQLDIEVSQIIIPIARASLCDKKASDYLCKRGYLNNPTTSSKESRGGEPQTEAYLDSYKADVAIGVCKTVTSLIDTANFRRRAQKDDPVGMMAIEALCPSILKQAVTPCPSMDGDVERGILSNRSLTKAGQKEYRSTMLDSLHQMWTILAMPENGRPVVTAELLKFAGMDLKDYRSFYQRYMKDKNPNDWDFTLRLLGDRHAFCEVAGFELPDGSSPLLLLQDIYGFTQIVWSSNGSVRGDQDYQYLESYHTSVEQGKTRTSLANRRDIASTIRILSKLENDWFTLEKPKHSAINITQIKTSMHTSTQQYWPIVHLTSAIALTLTWTVCSLVMISNLNIPGAILSITAACLSFLQIAVADRKIQVRNPVTALANKLLHAVGLMKSFVWGKVPPNQKNLINKLNLNANNFGLYGRNTFLIVTCLTTSYLCHVDMLRIITLSGQFVEKFLARPLLRASSIVVNSAMSTAIRSQAILSKTASNANPWRLKDTEWIKSLVKGDRPKLLS